MHPHTAAVAPTPIRVSAGARPYLLAAPSAPTAPKAARDFVRAVLHRTPLAPLADTAVLLASEAVTRSHLRVPAGAGTTGILVRVLTAAHGLRISVHDEGMATAPAPRGEAGRQPDPEQPDRGVLLLTRLADRWGTTPSEGPARSTSLWFELYAAGGVGSAGRGVSG